MDPTTLSKLQELVAQVFDGSLRRYDLLARSPLEKAYVATAIMIAGGEPGGYVYRGTDGSWKVMGNYPTSLHEIVQAGLYNPRGGIPPYWATPRVLRAAAKQAELYENVGDEPGALIRLTPPPELTALIAQYGRTAAIEEFLDAVLAGVRQERQWATEGASREREVLTVVEQVGQQLPPPGEFLDQLIATVNKFYGQRGLRDLRNCLNERLGNQ